MFDLVDWKKTGQAVQEAMLQRGMSSATVAHKAGVDRKTVDRLRSGKPIRLSSLQCTAQALDIDFENMIGADIKRDPGVSMASLNLGGYSYEAYKSYIGSYYLFRRSYDFNDRVICSSFEIYWDHDEKCLKYREKQNNKDQHGKKFVYSFEGFVSIPPGLAIAQFIGNPSRGFIRIITTTSLRGSDPTYFKGMLMGISETEAGFCPAVSPVYIERRPHYKDTSEEDPHVGSFQASDVWHSDAIRQLSSVAARFSAWAQA